MYTCSMKDIPTFANAEQIIQEHQELRNEITSDLKKHLKGPDEFTVPFVTELHKVIFVPHYFIAINLLTVKLKHLHRLR